ncbi:putative O-methyltransferase [Mycena sanguinolenta]|uniref:Putative O-methyltransferase n=1 Tax=Mycena sanguinolenta TaxID=230812 RepID=A0A8H6Z1R4_9AGAR|nr:putative O-methyltransferase [Mycena sanguinolenta]
MESDPEEIIAKLQEVGSAYAKKRPGAREQLLNLSHALIASLELPSETIQRMAFAEPARTAHCRIAVELKLFEYLKESGPEGISSQDLATRAGAHEVLISRIMKHLAAMKIIREKSPDIYVSSSFSEALTEPKHRDGIIYTYDVAGSSFRNLPEYLKSIKYDLPTDLTNGPFQAAHKTQLPFFAWIDQNPPYLQFFNSYMSGYRVGKPSWVDPGFYPIPDRLVKSFDPSISEVLLVDVGGGLGHDLVELKAKHPTLPGKLVLQDRPEVLSNAPDSGGEFEAVAHDFFTPQPVRGARTYYLHSVLHDWSDDDCVKILEQLKPAMKPGYSTVLISEIVVPRENATWPVTAMDQLMLVLGAMQERTESQWENILKRAGFKIQKIYSYEMGTESLIEAEME